MKFIVAVLRICHDTLLTKLIVVYRYSQFHRISGILYEMGCQCWYVPCFTSVLP